MDETSFYHYDPEIKQQSMDSGSFGSKNSKCKNPLEKFSPQLLGIKMGCSSLITFQRTKLSLLKKLDYMGFQCLDHPPYSLDLAPSDYYLFPGLKKQLKGRHFLSDAEIITATETWLDGQTSEFFEWLAKVRAMG